MNTEVPRLLVSTCEVAGNVDELNERRAMRVFECPCNGELSWYGITGPGSPRTIALDTVSAEFWCSGCRYASIFIERRCQYQKTTSPTIRIPARTQMLPTTGAMGNTDFELAADTEIEEPGKKEADMLVELVGRELLDVPLIGGLDELDSLGSTGFNSFELLVGRGGFPEIEEDGLLAVVMISLFVEGAKNVLEVVEMGGGEVALSAPGKHSVVPGPTCMRSDWNTVNWSAMVLYAKVKFWPMGRAVGNVVNVPFWRPKSTRLWTVMESPG